MSLSTVIGLLLLVSHLCVWLVVQQLLVVWNPQDLYSVVANHLWWCFPLDLSTYEHRCSWTLSQPLGCAPDCTLSCCYVLDSLLVFRLQGSLCCPVSWIFQATGRMSSTSSSHLRGVILLIYKRMKFILDCSTH